MAVAVPILLAAAGVGTTAAVITTIAFAVTGINDKINKAAASVFGEDLVKVANIAGMAYGAWNGGFSFGDGLTEATALADAANAESLLLAGDPMAAVEAANAADAAANIGNLAAGAGTDLSTVADATLAQSSALPQAFNLSDQASLVSGSTVSPQSNPFTAMTANDLAFQQPYTAPQFDLSPTAGAAGNSATAFAPAGSELAAAINGAPDITKQWSLADLLKNKDGSISNGALIAGGSVMQGVFGGYSAAKAREQQQAQYDAAVARQARLANLGTAGWKQTQ